MTLFLLHETAYGYALFERQESDEVGQMTPDMQEALADGSRVAKMVKLRAFSPFKSAAHALENANDVSEGLVNESLKDFLKENMPVASKKKTVVQLGVLDRTLAGNIKAALDGAIECAADETVFELLRAVRAHAERLLKGVAPGELDRAQLGLGHSYSRAKVKFNVHRSDNMIIQAIALLDLSDKDINTFAMRVREWYSWHFPELARLVPEHQLYARLVLAVGDKSGLGDGDVERLTGVIREHQARLTEAVEESAAASIAQAIVDAARSSMGSDISGIDLTTVRNFARQLAAMYEQRERLSRYLSGKMSIVAPNLAALIGNTVGARLIAHAGSLTNLAKYPASTVQILGAEKALFRALKTKSGKTPKYGLIYHASAIGKSDARNRGRISRYLANKCSIASRIDCFSETPCALFGDALRGQVENRVDFYAIGAKPLKNADVMHAVMEKVVRTAADSPKEKKEKKGKKEKAEKEEETDKKSKEDKKKKSGDKKRKVDSESDSDKKKRKKDKKN